MAKQPTIYKTIRNYNGKVGVGINWSWARFDDDSIGKTCLEECISKFPNLDHRGFYPAQPDSSNPNLHQGGFRFR